VFIRGVWFISDSYEEKGTVICRFENAPRNPEYIPESKGKVSAEKAGPKYRDYFPPVR
jgi:hypothetical protein